MIRARLQDAKGKSVQGFSAWQAPLNKLTDAVREIERPFSEIRVCFPRGAPQARLDPVTGSLRETD